MTLCVFALVASEFLPVSLLTPIATDLRVTEGLAGQGIAISGGFAVLTSMSISAIAGTMNRKTLLLALTALMGVSGAIVALASNYLTYMVGRALIGVVIGGFWSMSAAMAIRLVPTSEVPRALAVFNGGNALATVVAAPLSAWLGSVIGWRGAFWCLVPVALITFAWQWISLPAMHAEPRPAGSGNVFSLFKHRLVACGMAAVGLFFMGQFTLFTYVRAFLETVTRVDVATLSLILLVIGVSGLIGTMLISTFLQLGSSVDWSGPLRRVLRPVRHKAPYSAGLPSFARAIEVSTLWRRPARIELSEREALRAAYPTTYGGTRSKNRGAFIEMRRPS
jgi:predicted MFS family arabinose efflux permease